MLTSSALVATTTPARRSARWWRLACRLIGSPPSWIGLAITAGFVGSVINEAWWGAVVGVAAVGVALTFTLVSIASIEYE